MATEIFTINYEIPAGHLEVKITYDRSWTPYPLDFGIIDDIVFEYGYEDEDQLTFYPNKVQFKIGDGEKHNYETLTLSLGEYENTLPENHILYGGVELTLNGLTKFKGYIDELTLRYDEENRTCEFSAVDVIVALKDMNVDRDNIINPSGDRKPDNQIGTLRDWLYGVFKQLWIDFQPSVFMWNQINNNYYGLFIKHDWQFKGDDVLNTCEGQNHLYNGMAGDPYPLPDLGDPYGWLAEAGWYYSGHYPVYFNFDSTNFFGSDRPCRTWADYLRLIALQFGAIIGVMDYGKVYFVKRFGNYNAQTQDISDKVIETNFSKQIHLQVLRGVVIHNHWNGDRTYEYGNVERTPNGDYRYENRVKTIETHIGSYIVLGGKGTCIYTSIYYPPCTTSYVIGCWVVKDPQLSKTGQLFELVGIWQKENRGRPKCMVEIDVEGIDYDMVSIYKIALSEQTINFRAMTMKKSLLKNETHIVGIEI